MLLEVRNLETSYDLIQVLFGVSFSLGAGEVITLMGRNGMGKTTTVNSIMGLCSPRGGDVLLIICKLADRREMNTRGGLALKLIELNNDYDFVKFALSKDALYTRIDIHKRLIDADELKFLIDAMAHVVDESILSIKRFFIVTSPKRG